MTSTRMRHPITHGRRWLWQCLWVLLLSSWFVGRASAATYTVTNTNDSGVGSLRWAITQSNATSANDQIVFAAGANGVITLASPLPQLVDAGGNLTITGNGAANTIIDGADQHRPFRAEWRAGSTITLRGMTIRNGRADQLQGGAIFVFGIDALNLHEVALVGNSATYDGGAVRVSASSLTIENSVFDNNQCGTHGGALWVSTQSAIIRNTTLAQNKAVSSILRFADDTQAQLVNVSMVDNEATYTIHLINGSSTATLVNSMVVGNTVVSELLAGPGTSISATHSRNNLIGHLADPVLVDGVNGNQVGVSVPLVGVLGDYGGPTRTLPLLPGSPAINAGTAVASVTVPGTDQRGRPRLGAPDIGAFESQGFSMSRVGGNNQSTAINTAFADPLVVDVTAVDTQEPVTGGQVRFTAPTSGAGAGFSANPAMVANDGRAQTTATANATAGGPYTVTASLSDGTDPALSSAFSLTNVQPQADLWITKTDGVTEAVPGGSVTYTITAINLGPSAVTGATVSDTFPTSLSCIWTCVGAGGGTCTSGGSSHINDKAVNLPVNATVSYFATCAISASASGTLSNTATIAAPTGVIDPVSDNNSATDTTTLIALPALSIDDVSKNEGNAGTTAFDFTVSLSSPALAGGVSFDIATANGTAVAPGDYTARSLTGRTIPAGSSSYTFTVQVHGDTDVEADETFFVNVSNVTGATLLDAQGTGTILNDDDGCAGFAFPYTLAGADNTARVAELRAAIDCANGNSSADAIDLAGHTLVFADGPYVGPHGANALPEVTSELAIRNGALEREDGPARFRLLRMLAGSDLVMRDIQLRNGSVDGDGGAILVEGGALLLRDAVLSGHRAEGRGGAVRVSAGQVRLVTTHLHGNAARHGAAVSHAQPVYLLNMRIDGHGDATSGSVLHGQASAGMVNGLIVGNELTAPGSSLFDYDTGGNGRPELRNVTVADNRVQGLLFRAAADAGSSPDPVIAYNSIIWDNQSAGLGHFGAQYAIVQGAPSGIPHLGNQAPGFVDAPNDYRLADGSPGIDAGNPSYTAHDSFDLDGDGDVTEAQPDLDLNPRLHDDAGMADTGEGAAPLIDLGPYERQVDSVPAAITVDPVDGLVTTEAGGTATFTVVLARYPAAEVVIDLVSSDLGEGVVSPARLRFTPDNWNRPAVVTVMGVPDGVSDGDQPYSIVTSAATSADPAYDGMAVPDVSVINQDMPAPTSHVGGTVIGLAGDGLVLSLNAGVELLPITGNGDFTFAHPLLAGESYAVDILTQPAAPAPPCHVINGSGIATGVAISEIVVNCGLARTFAVGGTVNGLSGAGLAVRLNGGAALVVTAEGAYVFPERLPDGAGYVVSIGQQPLGQHCTLHHASGVIQGADVDNVDIDCAPLQAQLVLSVDDGRDYTRYGQVRDYVVTLANTGNATASSVAVAAAFSAAFDQDHVTWICLPSSGGACTGSGAGNFADIVDLPPNASVIWIVSVPVFIDSDEALATFSASHDHARAAGVGTAVDVNTLVILRDGFNVPYGDGAQSAGDPLPLRGDAVILLEAGQPPGGAIQTLQTFVVAGATVHVQQLGLRDTHWVRLLSVDGRGRERATAFVPMRAGAVLAVSHVAADDALLSGVVLLEGAQQPLALPLESVQQEIGR